MTKFNEKVIIFDTETHSINEPVVIEAAYSGLHDENTFCQRFNPGVSITLGAMAVHHITDDMVSKCPPSSSFKLPDCVQYIIGHNIDFDWSAIGKPNVKRICTLALARCYWPEIDSHTQSALMYYFFPKEAKECLINAHSALVDVLNLKMILQAMKESGRLGDINTIEKLWLISEQARIPKIMGFGKHKGEKIENIPADYKSWLLRQPDVDEYLVKALKG